MASIIKLKRSLTPSSVPSSLTEGEIAVNLEDKKLFVGGKNGGANVQVLSGDLYNLTSTNGSDAATITLTVDNVTLSNDSITFSAGEGIDISESSGTITIAGEDASDSNKGVASFSTDNFLVSSGAVTIKDGGVATAEIQDAAITAAKIAAKGLGSNTIADGAITSALIASKGIQANNIADGIITSAMISAGGVATNAIASAAVTNAKLQNPDITFSANTGSNIDVPLGSTLSIVSGTGTGVTVAVSANTVTVSGVDATSTFKGVASFDSGDFSVSSGAVSLADSATGAVIAINGTSNEVNVSRTNGTVTIGLPDDVTVTGQLNVSENVVVTGNTSIGGTLHVDGNLTVEGAVTYISSSTVNVDDSMLKLSANNAADTVDTGVYGLYIEAATNKFSGYFRDATDGVFKFYTDLEVEPTSTVNTGGTGYALAQVDAIIDGGIY